MWRSLAAHLLWDQNSPSAVLDPLTWSYVASASSAVLEIRWRGSEAQAVVRESHWRDGTFTATTAEGPL